MNVIIDNMVVSRVLVIDGDPIFLPVREKIFVEKTLRVVYGGKLLSEYERSRNVISMIRKLDQAGGAMAYSPGEIDARARKVKRLGLCTSNDIHVIALAQESGARLLCTEDHDLQCDFTNPGLVQKPRGKVYMKNTRAHKRLLDKYCRGCRNRRP